LYHFQAESSNQLISQLPLTHGGSDISITATSGSACRLWGNGESATPALHAASPILITVHFVDTAATAMIGGSANVTALDFKTSRALLSLDMPVSPFHYFKLQSNFTIHKHGFC
jgi:hypothetical protein